VVGVIVVQIDSSKFTRIYSKYHNGIDEANHLINRTGDTWAILVKVSTELA
jgi:hypothetical protein